MAIDFCKYIFFGWVLSKNLLPVCYKKPSNLFFQKVGTHHKMKRGALVKEDRRYPENLSSECRYFTIFLIFLGSSDRWQPFPNHSCNQHATFLREIKWKAIYHYGGTCHFVSFIFQNNWFLNTAGHSLHFHYFVCKNTLKSEPWVRLIMF